MPSRFQRQLAALQDVYDCRATPQTPEETLCLTADALRRTMGEARFLFYFSTLRLESNPLNLVPCSARQLSPGLFVYDHLKKTQEFSFHTDSPCWAAVASDNRPFGFLFVETASQPPDDLEYRFIQLLATHTAYQLEALYQTGNGCYNSNSLPKLIIDRTANRAWINNTLLPLKGKELATLQLLYHKREEVCSREMMRQIIYEDEPDSLDMRDSRLDLLVHKLRTKLNKVKDNPIQIETVRGQGYCLRLD